MPGSELEWVGVFVPMRADGPVMSAMFAGDTINHLLFTPNPATPYTPQTFPFTTAMYQQEEAARALYSADNPDLSGFAAHGGRLILYHGWSDPHISPLNTIDYVGQGPARRYGAHVPFPWHGALFGRRRSQRISATARLDGLG